MQNTPNIPVTSGQLPKRNSRLMHLLLALDLLVITGFAWYVWIHPEVPMEFNGQRALQDVVTQVEFGPRTPGTAAHAQALEYFQAELAAAGWQSEIVTTTSQGQPVENLRAWRGTEQPVILLGAHYDSRLLADKDDLPANRSQAVPGANDGASGVAVLLELARTLPKQAVAVELAFFDAEDNGHLPGWDWILGSRAYAAALTSQPKAVVVVDMIGDADLKIFMEGNSDPQLSAQLWRTATRLGYETTFVPEIKYHVLDDHIPFLEKGLRTVDLIDLDYAYWHTLQDTPDKVSAVSLEKVGKTLLAWIAEYGSCLAAENCTAQ